MGSDLTIVIRRLKRDVIFHFKHRVPLPAAKDKEYAGLDRDKDVRYIRSLIAAIQVLRKAHANQHNIIRIDDGPEGCTIRFEETP